MDLFELSTHIAHELPHLLDKQRPYERPDALTPSKISTLTGLRRVTEAIEGRSDTFRERVAALPIVFREALTEDPELRGSAIVRDALTYLGLSDDPTLVTLTARREEISKRRGITGDDSFRHTHEGPLRGIIALRLAEYEFSTEDRAYGSERADVLVFRDPDELTIAAEDIILGAGTESPAIYCVGCTYDLRSELYPVTSALVVRAVTDPRPALTIVFASSRGSSPDRSLMEELAKYIGPVVDRETSGLLLIGNEKRGFVCLPTARRLRPVASAALDPSAEDYTKW